MRGRVLRRGAKRILSASVFSSGPLDNNIAVVFDSDRAMKSGTGRSLRDDSYKVSMTLLTFLAAAVIALALAIGLPTFATLQMSSTCPLVNPRSGVAQSSYFLSLFGGLSSRQELCINNDEDFCISWSSPAWTNFSQIDSSASLQGLVYGGAALVVAALCTAFFALVLLSLCLLYTSPSPRDRQKSRMPSSA